MSASHSPRKGRQRESRPAVARSVASQKAGTGDPPVALHTVAEEHSTLYEIIQTIGSGPDLEAILRSVVRLVTEATSCNACFVYLVHDDVLVLRAASSAYAHLEGTVTIPIGDGLTGWVARTRRSAFITDDAAGDPRVRGAFFPELGDEQYQSLVSVPVFSRAGDVVGVITLHAEAPHEFSQHDLELLEHTASLVAGAAENAQLNEDARARIALLTELSGLAEAVASASDAGEVLQTVVEGCRRVTGAERCEIYLLDGPDRLTLRAASPPRSGDRALDTRGLWVGSMRKAPGTREGAVRLAGQLWDDVGDETPLFVPLVVGDEPLGLIALLSTANPADTERVMSAVASHTAVALKQHRLIDWLRDANRVTDLFEALAAGRASTDEAIGHAVGLGLDLDSPHLVLELVEWSSGDTRTAGSPARGPNAIRWPEVARRVEARLVDRFAGSLFDRREASVRALLPIGPLPYEEAVTAIEEAVMEVKGSLARSISIGVSGPCQGVSSFRFGFEEAAVAGELGGLVHGGPGVTTYQDLGPYRYVSATSGGRDHNQTRLERIVEYDRRRGTQLIDTLETHLEHKCNTVATSKVLYIHPNTLRQRLDRIERIAGVDLEHDDWLSLAIAIKVLKLRQMREANPKLSRADDDG
jgi:GAF domain-containing protein